MNFQDLSGVQQSLRARSGAKDLGSLLWWHLNGNRITHPDLLALAHRHGLDVRYIPNDLKPTQAFRRAWRHTTSKLADGLMLRLIAETNEITVGLVREKPDTSRRDLDYDILTRISFDKTTAMLSADQQHPVVDQIRELYRHHLAHTSEDVRSMMTRFLGEAGVSLRDSGGVYFVPASHAVQLEALCRVVNDIGKTNKTFVLPIVDTPEARATLREVTQASLDDEVRALEDELENFDPEKVRSTTLERRLQTFEELKGRVGLFAGVLSFKAAGLNQRLGVINAELRRSLGLEAPPSISDVTEDELDAVSVPIPRRAPIAPVSAEIGF